MFLSESETSDNYEDEQTLEDEIESLEQDILNKKIRLDILKTIKSTKFGTEQSLDSQLYLGCDEKTSFQAFGDKHAFETISKTPWRLFDATFKITPKISPKNDDKLIPYHQCWIIHGVHVPKDGTRVPEALPCIWVLMTKGETKQLIMKRCCILSYKKGLNILTLTYLKIKLSVWLILIPLNGEQLFPE